MPPGGGLERATRHAYEALSGTWTKTRVDVVIEDAPFDAGAMRTAHKMYEVEPGGHRAMFVAKFYKHRVSTSAVLEDAKLSMVAETYAHDFNKRSGLDKTVAFVPSYALELHDRGGVFCCCEPVLQGQYLKHNNNDGAVASRRLVPQAFSHFTYESSRRDLLVCDIQGVGDYYTDPQIVTRDGKGHGLGNTGGEGIRKFLSTHVCNDVCRVLMLPRISGGSGNGASKGQGTVMAERMAREERAIACRGDAELARQLQRGQR